MGKLLEIKKGNEVFEIHQGENGIFLVFGARTETQSKVYEMNLDEQDVESIRSVI